MKKIELGVLSLAEFDKSIPEHVAFYKKLISDKSITSRFCGLLPMLNMDINRDRCFNKGYFVLDGDEYVGYIDLGRYCEAEKAVYLRGAIVKEKRNMGYGSLMLAETSDYIFYNYPEVQEIKLKTAEDNTEAINTIKACDFHTVYGTLYSKKNPYTKEKKYTYSNN